MQVKTFRAPTISEALEQVKQELGAEAVILSNRRVSGGSDQVCVEVMAAVEPEPVEMQPAVKSARVEAPPVGGGDQGTLLDDVREIKEFLSFLVSSKDGFNRLQRQEPLSEIYHNLLLQGLDEKSTYILLMKAVNGMRGDQKDSERIYKSFCDQMMQKIRFSRPFRNVASPDNTFIFVGPTGVGKTTTLAKLAAYLKIKRQLEVGFVSVDSYRIGALEQLQTYADILEVPMYVARNRQEMSESKKKLGHCDVILVDTIGKNFLDHQQVKDLQDIFGDTRPPVGLLVLSAAAKDADIRQTIINFRPLKIDSLVFTKVDETLSPAGIINQLLRFPYPVSYFCTGQSVPDDIEPATTQRLLSFLSLPTNGAGRKEHHGPGDGTS
jgi:flagellar biosynthesis protein FlhF